MLTDSLKFSTLNTVGGSEISLAATVVNLRVFHHVLYGENKDNRYEKDAEIDE